MSKSEIFEQYKNDVDNLKKCAKNLGLSNNQITKIFKESFDIIDKENSSSNSNNNAQTYFWKVFKISAIFAVLAFFIYILLNVHLPTSSIVLRNVQGLIYPGLTVLRFLSVPIIKQFPSLTRLYDESCLVENPYFYVEDMECWPCENIHSVIDLTGLHDYTLYKSGAPHIVKLDQEAVEFADIQELFLANKNAFINEASSINSNNSTISDLNSLFSISSLSLPSSAHISWRINKMLPARLIRTLFPRPYVASEWSGQSIERFVMLDGSESGSYAFPNTECSYVFATQGSGERTIILKPSRECGKACRTVSVVLKQSYVLWYNWWYWRPISLPAGNTTKSSVTYITSFC